MAFFQLLLKAEKVEKARLRYEDEKLRSIEISEGVKPRITLKQRLRRKRLKWATNFSEQLPTQSILILIFKNINK